jgi:hypothetical protein
MKVSYFNFKIKGDFILSFCFFLEFLEARLMRLTSFGIVLVLATSFLADQTNAQIPERVLFQPGSYVHSVNYSAYSPYSPNIPQPSVLPSDVAVAEKGEETDVDDEADDEANKTEWEITFGVDKPLQEDETAAFIKRIEASPASEKTEIVPYLAYYRNPWTHRIHVVPYQPGYAAEPEAFPEHQSKLNLWLSSLPSREQNRPQIQYASYYDPDPVIITDKPSRLQLILGYSNASWTSCCDNRWGHRLAQCPGVEPVALGGYAEVGIKDQPIVPGHPGVFGGVFSGLRPLDYGQAAPPQHGFGLKQVPLPARSPSPPVYSREVLQQIVEHRASYAGLAVTPQRPQPIPYPPTVAHREPFRVPPPPQALQPQAPQPVPVSADNRSCETCQDCKKKSDSCRLTSCKSCATTKTAHRSLKNKKAACETENNELTEK